MNKTSNSLSFSKKYEEIYNEYYSYVFRVAYGIAGNHADAEDISQETFLAIYNSLKTFRGKSKLSTWIYRITIRIAIRLVSKRKPSIVARLEGRLSYIDEKTDLLQAISELSLPLKTAIILVALQGMTHAEAAEVLDIPEGTIASRIHTAKKKLNEKLNL